MLRRLGVRGKILATLAVPIFVLLVAATYISWGAWQDAVRAGQSSDLVDSLELQDRAGTAVATERALAMLALNDVPGAMDQLVDAQEASDEAVDARDEALLDLDVDALSVGVQDAIEATVDDRTALDELQRQVISGQVSESSAITRYTDIIERAMDVPRAVAAAEPDAGLAERLNAYVALDEVMLANTYERPLVALALSNAAAAREEDPDDPQYNAQLMQQMVAALQETNELQQDAAEQLGRLGGDYVLPGYDERLSTLRTQLRWLTFSGFNQSDAAQWSDLSQGWIEDTRPVRDDVRADTVSYAADLATDARLRAGGTAGATFGIVLLSFVFALIIARRIVNPLRRLTTATADVRDRLPQMVEQMAVPGQAPSVDLVQIPVESSDEIGRLANAFNEVNATTVEVAREQAALRGSIAEMFVNVARRDQVLLNRQLAFLDELERSEEDPSTLSNLFRLDHLATRMRRNAESLLVLAGIDSGRRVRNPMPVSDVIRTASSEIELYDRVRLELHADPHMLGHNALNAAHLLAELLENATMFSEPHTPVEVSTVTDARGVVVTVRDHGLGMSTEEIAEANAKVASTAASDAVGAQRLGLFVVGRLAARLGATVEFASGTEGKGTVVTVSFPAALFLADEAMPLPQPTDPLEAATQRSASQLGASRGASELTGAAPATVPAGPEPSAADAPDPEPAVLRSESSTVATPEPAPYEPAPHEAEPEPYRPQAPEPRPETAPAPALYEPEPPTAEPVDIDALTDGTTATGMPRRRRGDSGSPTESIVLPPLETPSLDTSEQIPEEGSWSPPSEVAGSAAAALPSRRRGNGEPAPMSGALPLPAAEEPTAKPIEVEQRTGLFSSFRSMERLEEGSTESTLQLDAVSGDPADVPESFGAEPATPEQQSSAAAAEERPVPAAEHPTPSPTPAPAPADAPAPVRSTSWAEAPSPATAPTPVGQSAPDSYTADSSAMEPPSSSANGRAEPEDSPQELESLPAFEELMSNLPTRRGELQPSGRKRGLFGRKPAVQSTESAAAAAAESVTGAQASSDRVDAARTEAWSAPAEPARPDPVHRTDELSGLRHPAVVDPFASDAVPPATAATPAPARPAPATPAPADRRAEPLRPAAPAQSAASSATPSPAFPAPVAFGQPAVEEVPYQPRSVEPEDGRGPRAGEDRPATADAAAPTGTAPTANGARAASYGDSVLPLRSTVSSDADPLDPHYVPDTIEARSEWMASAVLYEEMSTLMQRGVFQEENVTTSNEEQTYRPATAAPTAAPGLTRRARPAEPAAPADRFTASIERDPEQLRARLSAFQSATARGRSEASDDGGLD
ncbi:hypothetical protein GCM10023216_00060 [Isoptericola chiayiensis]|uniref:histidine kinase n=1 Tax=Isoptericola chiayiensis TaxID=579446 RepID=A0ABP8XVN7_9MICO|nr:nitrate- and nitrite sensing domain-containing protein [Isoptericola chiayiensis]